MSKYCCLTLTSPPMERIWSPLACDLHVLNVFACTTLCIVYHIVSNTHTYTVHFDLVYCHIVGKPSKVQTFMHQVDIQIYGGGGGRGRNFGTVCILLCRGMIIKITILLKKTFAVSLKTAKCKKIFHSRNFSPSPCHVVVSAGGVLHLAGIPQEEVEASEGPEAREEAAASHAAARTLRRTPP